MCKPAGGRGRQVDEQREEFERVEQLRRDGEALPLRAERRDGGLYVHLSGEIDIAVVDSMAGELEEELAIPCPVLMDLLHVEFADSSLIRLIGMVDRRIRPHGHRIKVIGASTQVRRLLELTGLDTVVDLGIE